MDTSFLSEIDEIIDSNGQIYVKRPIPMTFGPFDLGIVKGEGWCPVSDINTDDLVTMAAFGGWFGLHRFAEGAAFAGLFYLLSCGCCGILPVLDIIQYICGAKSIISAEYGGDGFSGTKRRVFLRKPEKGKWAAICVGISLIISLVAWCVIYRLVIPYTIRCLFSLMGIM